MAIIEIKIPSPGESISSVELTKWLVEDGSVVRQNTEIAELESDKATLMLTADKSGKILFKAKEGELVDVGSVACTIDTSVQPPAEEEKPQENVATSPKDQIAESKQEVQLQKDVVKEKSSASEEYDKVKFTPLAKKMMETEGISVEDVVEGLRRLGQKDVELSQAALHQYGSFKSEASRDSTSEPMSSLRRRLSERLVSVKNETAMLTTFNEVDMKQIMSIRKKYQEQFVKKHGIKLGMMSFFMKACAVALQEFPKVNSSIDGNNLVTYQYVDISVAVSTDKGLMVPVVRNVESLGLAEIEKAISELATKARNSKLSIPEMTGGTFTITNGGVFGSMMSTPLINPPQSAILGMHNIIERPIAVDGQVVIRPMMYIALSYDHRVIDGKDSVSFLKRVKTLLENPTDLMYKGSSGERALLEI